MYEFCNPMDCNMPGFSVLHYLLEFSQPHIHWGGDAIQPSHALPPPSPFTSNLSPNQGIFQWVSSSNQVAKILELSFQHQSFQWIFRVDFLVWSPCSPRDSQESSVASQFKASILQSSDFFIDQFSHPYMTTRKTKGLTILASSNISAF